MLVFIKNMARLVGVESVMLRDIKNLLTLHNPLFGKKLDLNLSVVGIPKFLKYYRSISETSIEVPVGALPEILKKFDKKDIEIIDSRVSNLQPDYFSSLKFTGKLRDYQEDIIQACLPKTVGIVQAMTGSGKTIVFIALIMKRQEPTLILVNTLELANQTISSFTKFTNIKAADIGFIGDGRFEIKPVTVGLHQTMAKLEDNKFNLIDERFGQIIADEVHICGAQTYYRTMTHLSAKYKYGFSATPKRDDGLTEAIHFATGPTIHEVPKDKLTSVLITPSYKTIDTEYQYYLFNSQEYQEMITDMAEDVKRNKLIVDTWKKNYKGRSTIILCLRVAHLEILHKMLPKESVMLHSKMKKKDRASALEQIISGEKTIVLSTYGLFSTGIDVPRLEVLMLAAPMKSEVKLKQAAGRLMRMCKGKTSAEIVDFVDKNIDLLKFQYYKRGRILRAI
jgi:superfamily II DNA or RNA helicase